MQKPEIISIYKKPTYDLNNITLIEFDEDNALLFFKTNDVFSFDKVYWNVTIRSRVIRPWKDECKYIEDIASAIIDAWYNWHLHWKIKLTKDWLDLCKNSENLNDLAHFFENAFQIYLFQSIAWNYYNWTSNRLDLETDIVFTI